MGKMRSTHRRARTPVTHIGLLSRLNLKNQTTSTSKPNVENQTTGTSKPSEVNDNEVRARKHDLVVSTLDKLKYVVSPSSTPCIFRVPRALRKVNEEAYTPQVVSIGPYHQGAERLKPMEEHKLRYLSEFLGRGPSRRVGIEGYLEEEENKKHVRLVWLVGNLRELEEHARQSYGHTIKDESDTFVAMMLLDGCFIIELFFKFMEDREEVVARDPLFLISSMITAIRVDMLLLENQLPFFILERIFILATGEDKKFMGASFVELTLKFFNFKYLLNMARNTPSENSTYHIKHFLDLLRRCSLPLSPNAPIKRKTVCIFIPSATELHEAGVKFKKATGKCMLDLKFTKGIFEIPALIVEDTTELLFRNLIALEQCSEISVEQYITHYLALMDFLINSPHDVAKLRRAGIIDNWLGDNEQVSVLFNKIFIGVTMSAKSFYFHELAEQVNVYYKTTWHSLRALLDREYFYSPWSTASSIAVIIVVLCTIIQTVCTVIQTTH